MKGERQGGCACGEIRYALEGEPLAVTICHCTQCQQQSGSAFSMSMIVPRDRFRLLAGAPSTFETQADSGASKDCVFCPTCGVRLYNALSSMPATINVKPGTLDDTSGIEPKLEVWCSSKQDWLELPERRPRFGQNPTRGVDHIERPKT